MHTKTAFVDDVLMAREFRAGDFVRRTNYRSILVTPFVGRVVYSNTNTGVVMVQWPYGAVLEPPTELIKVGSLDFLPPLELDQAYSTYEKSLYSGTESKSKDDAKWRKSVASSIVSDFESLTMPVYRAACAAMNDGLNEVDAFVRLSSEFGDEYGFDTVKRTVSNLYSAGRRYALYWKESQRKYRRSRGETASGSYNCPRCKTGMTKRRYTHKADIRQCNACGFAIRGEDII